MITRAIARKIEIITNKYTQDEIDAALGLMQLHYSRMFTLEDVVQ